MRYADNSFVSNAGSPIHVLYSPVIQDDGSVKLEVSGSENSDDFIQSFAESTDMAVIMARLKAGDTSVLNQATPSYGDFTQAPKTYAEALQLVIDGKSAFERLPLDVRASFDHDFNRWFASAGSEDWLDKMSPVLTDEMRSINKMSPVLTDEMRSINNNAPAVTADPVQPSTAPSTASVE